MRLLALIACAMLTGCIDVPPPMSRDEVIAAVNQCEEAGMRPVLATNWHNRVADVQCYPYLGEQK